MNQHDRRRALNSELGTALRGFLNDALNDARYLPSKSAIRSRIAEDFGDYEGVDQDKLFNLFAEFARRGQDRQSRFELRGHIDEVAARVFTKLEDADRLVPVPDEPTAEDIDAAVQTAADPYKDRIGGELDRARDAEIEKAREIVRKASETKSV